MSSLLDRELIDKLQLPSGGHVLIEADAGTTYIAWSTPGGGRGDAAFPRLSAEAVALVVAVFREEGTELTSRSERAVRERLEAAMAPDETFLDVIRGAK